MSTDPVRGYLAALAAAALVGFTPVASKVVLAHLAVPIFGALWFGVAGGYALGFIALTRRARVLVLPRRQLVFALLVGVANGLAGLLYFRAIQIADPALVGFYTRVGTLITVVTGVVVFRERPAVREWLAVGMVVAGSGLLGSGASEVELVAFALVFGAMVATSASYAFAKGAVAQAHPLAVVAYRGVASSLTFAAAAVVVGDWDAALGPSWWALPVGAFVGPFLSFVLLFEAFRHLPLGRASGVHAINPIFTAVYAALFFGGTLDAADWVGGLVATAGVVVLVSGSRAAEGIPPSGSHGGGVAEVSGRRPELSDTRPK